ncbi:MAG: hypothetical protein KBD29_04455 [Candidatus Magasanikbacteria bacterium]|nr:hypothetical protein [Candidatus Magasanikbacteria bacterium]
MNKILLLLIVGAVAVGSWYYVTERPPTESLDIVVSEPTDFVEIGTLKFPPVDSGQSTGTFVYEENGVTVTSSLILDEWSICQSILCMAMSVTFDMPFNNKRALVEGNKDADGIRVKKIRVLEAGEMERAHESGDRFIAWIQAIRLFESCDVRMATQTHALDVYLHLSDGQEVRAVEPGIDEMFVVINRTRETCGTFPVATE